MIETFIHPSAVIDPNAQIGAGAHIGPYCIVGPDVTLGARVVLKGHVVVDGITTIGDDTVVYPFASLGSEPQDLKFGGEKSQLIIGKRNKIREHVTMNPGTIGDRMKTVVGDDCLFMVGAHVAHDCVVGNRVILANNATLAGHVVVGDHAILGGLSAVRQRVRIGNNAMIGGMSGVENDVIPFGLVMGERAYLAGLNLVGLERSGYEKAAIQSLMKAFKALFNTDDATFAERLSQIESDYSNDALVSQVTKFVREKAASPLCQPKNAA